jgi:hypothetical protein
LLIERLGKAIDCAKKMALLTWLRMDCPGEPKDVLQAVEDVVRLFIRLSPSLRFPCVLSTALRIRCSLRQIVAGNQPRFTSRVLPPHAGCRKLCAQRGRGRSETKVRESTCGNKALLLRRGAACCVPPLLAPNFLDHMLCNVGRRVVVAAAFLGPNRSKYAQVARGLHELPGPGAEAHRPREAG